MKVSEAFVLTVSLLKENGIENPAFEADCLFESLFSTDRLSRINHPEREIDFERIREAVEKRISGVPLQYILGKWNFFGFEYFVGEGVLIPRPETEILVEKSIELIKGRENPVIFDLCAGTGCIGLTLARLVGNSEVYLFEKSEDAFKYLKKNAQGIENVHLIKEDIFLSECQKYKHPDLIVSNPPYVNKDELPLLQKEVLFEPLMALDGGEDGLDFYRIIASKWLKYLNTDGFIAVECGESQSRYIEEMFSFTCKKTYSVKDYNNIDRIVIGEK